MLLRPGSFSGTTTPRFQSSSAHQCHAQQSCPALDGHSAHIIQDLSFARSSRIGAASPALQRASLLWSQITVLSLRLGCVSCRTLPESEGLSALSSSPATRVAGLTSVGHWFQSNRRHHRPLSCGTRHSRRWQGLLGVARRSGHVNLSWHLGAALCPDTCLSLAGRLDRRLRTYDFALGSKV